MSESEQDRPARNMADIARMFLDGARAGAPKRVGPGERAAQQRAERRAPEAAGSRWEMAPIMLGICGGGGWDAWRKLSRMATGLAEEHATTVCLMGMRDGKFVIEIAGSESAEDLPRITVGAGSADMQVARVLYILRESVGHWLIASPETQGASFAGVGAAVSQWVLACDASNEGVVAAYQQLKRAVMRATPVLPARCYMLTDDLAEASLVHGRLRTAAGEFLRQELPLAGAGNRQGECSRVAMIAVGEGALEHERLWTAVLDELCGATVEDVEAVEVGEELKSEKGEAGSKNQEEGAFPPAGASHVIEERPDSSLDVESALERVARASEEVSAHSHQVGKMFDHLAHVLDPEERAALGAGFGDEDVDFESPEAAAAPVTPAREVRRPMIADIRREVVPPSPPVLTQVPAEPVKPAAPMAEEKGRGMTLRAFDLLDEQASDRGAQWQAVERSIKDLVAESVVLDARPPMSWASDCCLSIDAEGGLHVWTLYKDGVSWFALREWAAEHRNLLALTRRDLVLAREGEVTVHIVLPLENGRERVDSSGHVKALLRAPNKNVFIYRLRSVQWNGRRGILVVPIA